MTTEQAPRASARTALFIATTVLLLACVASAASCSGGGSAQPLQSNSIGNSTSTRAIHVIAKRPNGTSVQLNFGPGTDVHFGTSNGGANNGPQSVQTQSLGLHGGLHILTGGAGSDGGTPVQNNPTIDEPEVEPWDTAWALVWRAAIECGGVTIPNRNTGNDLPWQSQDGYQSWFYYEPTGGCSGALAIEQNLLCVADRLAAVSDAVGTTFWPSQLVPRTDAGVDAAPYAYPSTNDASPPNIDDAFVEWDIPPQSDADRFIVRDLAIYVLGLIPTVDSFTGIGLSSTTTCTDDFALFREGGEGPAGGSWAAEA